MAARAWEAVTGTLVLSSVRITPQDDAPPPCATMTEATWARASQNGWSLSPVKSAEGMATGAVQVALQDAAARGVAVTLILPGQTDSWLVFHAGRARYAALLQAGVRIVERQDAILHAKTALIDGVWSTVGSTNLDWRSFLHNQVRGIVGTLERVGAGAWTPEDVRTALEAKDRAACGPVSPPQGLYLVGVAYPADPFAR